MGVELGKVLAKNILAQLDKPEDVTGHDSSVSLTHSTLVPDEVLMLTNQCSYSSLRSTRQTTGLIHYYQKHRKE